MKRGDVDQWSSSSRRTWIEICSAARSWDSVAVVLLAEDVDRNLMETMGMTEDEAVVLLAEDVDRNASINGGMPYVDKSSSSRRTWIEISSIL